MVPQIPPDLRQKLRAAYPAFGISDVVVRWVVPAGLVLALVSRSWPMAIGAVVIFVAAWMIRARQFPRIVESEGDTSLTRRSGDELADLDQPPGLEYMRPYYETWPLLHKRYGHPIVAEAVEVWCPEHDQWESGEIQAMVSPGAFIDAVNLNIEFNYGDHSWKMDGSTSLVDQGSGSYGSKEGRLWEIRARNASDMALLDGEYHELAIAVLFSLDSAWGLVAAHLDSLEHWKGLDRMVAEMPIALPD